MNYTENLSLGLPEYGESADVVALNRNSGILDAYVYNTRQIECEPYDPTKNYMSGDLAIHNEVIYECNTDNTTGAWDDSKWDSTTLAEQIAKAKQMGGESALADLEDVEITNPSEGQILTYDDTNDEWVNTDMPDASVTKTATGNPIEITDGASAPMVKCETVIQGYQEGTGTPSPENVRPIHAYTQTTISVVGVEKYGFHIDGSKSVPTEMVSYLSDCDNANYTPAHMDYASDKFDYGSWENAWFIQGVRPCILGTDGTVIKYLDKNNYTKDIDGYTVDIGGTLVNANVMVEFPKIWLKVVPDSDDNTSANVYISNIKLDDGYKDYAYINYQKSHKNHFYLSVYNSSTIDSKLRSLSGQTTTKTKSLTGTTEISYAEANGVGWSTEHAGQIMLINFLLILIGKSTNTQVVFGQGLNTGGSEAVNSGFETGVHNAKGLFYGTNSGAAATYTNAVKVFGIENWWGFQWQRYRGDILSSNTLKIKLCYGQEDGSTVDNFNTDATGYRIVSGGSATGTSGQYISQMVFDTGGMYAKEANNSNASSTSKYCDGYWFNGSGVRFTLRGGYSSTGALVGALYVSRSSGVEGAGWNVGARLSYI